MRQPVLALLLGLVVPQVARSQGTSPGEIATLKLGDRQDARLVAFSPDGRLLALAGEYSDTRIWDVTTARRLYTLKGHSATAITFSPDGKLLASAGASVVLLWDVQSGKQQGKLEVPFDRGWIYQTRCLAFRPDGKTLVGACTVSKRGITDEKCTALISWEVKTGKMIGFDELDKECSGLWLSADGGTVARWLNVWDGQKYILRVRDLANKKDFDLTFIKKDNERVAVALSPDGKVAAIGDKLWDVTTGKQLVTLRAESLDRISYLSFSPDGNFVAAVGTKIHRITQTTFYLPLHTPTPVGNASIGIYKVKTGEVVFAFSAHEGAVHSLAITRNGQTMASVSEDKTVKLWDLDP
jgi:WD40 repeat protein